jgi:hypothetical protein
MTCGLTTPTCLGLLGEVLEFPWSFCQLVAPTCDVSFGRSADAAECEASVK